MDENRLLRELDVTKADRDHIEGLQATSLTGRPGRSEAQVALLALLRLSTDPPAAVGRMQRRTAQKMLRMYPLGCVSYGFEQQTLSQLILAGL
eukprot:140986-Prymnesium_polylepis.2